MSYRLREHVTFCVVGDQPVFLDVRRNRYFGVGEAAACAFQALVEQAPATDDSLATLIKAGLIEAAEAVTPLRPIETLRPTHSLLEDRTVNAHANARLVAEAAMSLARARVRLKARPLLSIVHELRVRRARLGELAMSTHRALAVSAASFNAVRHLIPMRPVCLLDSLALLDVLARRGLIADLVFGVKLHPFGAHCWLQTGQTVLNDSIDRANLHTPILLV
jgi:hypothetical protein